MSRQCRSVQYRANYRQGTRQHATLIRLLDQARFRPTSPVIPSQRAQYRIAQHNQQFPLLCKQTHRYCI
eukprot:4972132-Pleurochrysis_carterae.AAC.2